MPEELVQYTGFFIALACFVGGFFIGYQSAIDNIFGGGGGES